MFADKEISAHPSESIARPGIYDPWNLARKITAADAAFNAKKVALENAGVYSKNIQKTISAERRNMGTVFIRDIGMRALASIAAINEAHDRREDLTPHYDTRDALVMETILAMWTAKNIHYENALTGASVGLQEYFREEPFTEEAANRVTVRVPHPQNPDETVAIFTTLDKVVAHTRRALQRRISVPGVVTTFIKGVDATPERETDDEFIIRKAYEASTHEQKWRRTAQTREDKDRERDIDFSISMPLLQIWLDRMFGPKKEDSEVDLKIGFITGSQAGGDRLFFLVTRPRGKSIDFTTITPWQAKTPPPGHRILVQRIIDSGHPFDFMVGGPKSL